MIKEAYIINKVFSDQPYEVMEKWEEIFDKGTTKFFEYGFVTHFKEDGVLYVNSASVDDTPFNTKMLVYILRLVKNEPDVVLGSTIRNIRTLLDNGFEYDYVNEIYIRGNKYYKQIAERRKQWELE